MKKIDLSTLDFLRDIKKNNYREWFQKNRQRYLDAKADYESFVQEIINEISRFDPILKGLEASSCTYRINRDIRFSEDKTLYKTHFGAFIVKGGKKNGDRFAGYYIHVEPGNNSMVAGGAYLPPAQWLYAIRQKIDEQGDLLENIMNNKAFKEYFGQLDGEKLKGVPKGYGRDHKYIELLRMKSFIVSSAIKDSDLTTGKGFDFIVKASREIKPLNDFLNDY
ncbi:MAG: DUF2461 domain-containing protein [Bacteroidales bacterium]|nr:DUF2461 domain-containing protein [Bacteroidales bacterium]